MPSSISPSAPSGASAVPTPSLGLGTSAFVEAKGLNGGTQVTSLLHGRDGPGSATQLGGRDTQAHSLIFRLDDVQDNASQAPDTSLVFEYDVDLSPPNELAALILDHLEALEAAQPDGIPLSVQQAAASLLLLAKAGGTTGAADGALPGPSSLVLRTGGSPSKVQRSKEPASILFHLQHSFLVVREPQGTSIYGELVVETQLREHLRVARASAHYEALLAQLPQVFVGHAVQLANLARAFGRLMEAEYKAQGLAVPPWRQSRAILSKWMPAAYNDVPAATTPGAVALLLAPATASLVAPTAAAAKALLLAASVDLLQDRDQAEAKAVAKAPAPAATPAFNRASAVSTDSWSSSAAADVANLEDLLGLVGSVSYPMSEDQVDSSVLFTPIAASSSVSRSSSTASNVSTPKTTVHGFHLGSPAVAGTPALPISPAQQVRRSPSSALFVELSAAAAAAAAAQGPAPGSSAGSNASSVLERVRSDGRASRALDHLLPPMYKVRRAAK